MIKSKTTIDLSEERRILSRMIVNTDFLSQLKDIALPNYFQASYSRTVAGWIWEYFEFTKAAPGRNIEDLYLKKKNEIHDEDDTELVAEFLQNLSQDWERDTKINVKYTVKSAVEYFKLQSLNDLKSQIERAVSEKDWQAGERAISTFRRVERMGKNGISILSDTGLVQASLSEEHETMFAFPGALGQVVGSFRRGDFFAIMGAPKRGKTWWLLYSAFRAVMMQYKVLFISLEMVESAMIRRIWKCLVAQPTKTEEIAIPYFEDQATGGALVKSKMEMRQGIRADEVAAKQKVIRAQVRSGDFRLVTAPTHSMSAEDIDSILNNYEYYEGFIPDVVVVDYADILKPINTKLDYRHQLDQTWKKLRSIAQDRELLMITGSQTGRSALKKDAETGDVAEDMRKLAHVTKMIALNQNIAEKKDGVMRISSLLQREEAGTDSQAVVLMSLGIGRPYIDSRLREQVNMDKYEGKKIEKDDENIPDKKNS